MKRFHWPLQRLLEVTLQREQVFRVKLLALANKIVAVHQEMFRRQACLRSTLAELAQMVFGQRLPRQQIFMAYSAAEEARGDLLKKKLKDLQGRRTDTMADFARERSLREGLERLREEAVGRYAREIAKQERKQLDESFQVAFVHKMLEKRCVDK